MKTLHMHCLDTFESSVRTYAELVRHMLGQLQGFAGSSIRCFQYGLSSPFWYVETEELNPIHV